MHMFQDGHYMGMHSMWWIFLLLLLVIGVVVFSSWGRLGGRRRSPNETPHAVLQRRLASGEITPEEYQKRKALLDHNADGKL